MDRSEPLLYDPLFASPPDTVIRDTPGRGFFGKAAVKKALFILVLLVFVGGAIAVSFSSLSQDRLEYAETTGGAMLSAFRAGPDDAVLAIDTAGEDAGALAGQPVTAVRQFAVCGNEVTAFILIGKHTVELPNTAFYDCAALAAVLVDPENPALASVDGVLYRKENGRLTELVLYPRKNALYRAALSLGWPAPAEETAAAAFAARLAAWEKETGVWETVRRGEDVAETDSLPAPEAAAVADALRYEIPEGVTRVGEMAFAECPGVYAVSFPATVTEIGQMAFFKCGSLREAPLTDTVAVLGPDAFSYCVKFTSVFIPAGVTEIGHHAFYGCKGVGSVYVAKSEADAPLLGQDWVPKSRRLFEHNVPVVFGAERGDAS